MSSKLWIEDPEYRMDYVFDADVFQALRVRFEAGELLTFKELAQLNQWATQEWNYCIARGDDESREAWSVLAYNVFMTMVERNKLSRGVAGK